MSERKLVPVEPTKEMYEAAFKRGITENDGWEVSYKDIYQAMLAAAPSQPSPSDHPPATPHSSQTAAALQQEGIDRAAVAAGAAIERLVQPLEDEPYTWARINSVTGDVVIVCKDAGYMDAFPLYRKRP